MANQTNLVGIDAFATAFFASDGADQIWFGEDLAWHVRAETKDGMFVLAKPDGTTGYSRLEGLLSLLAGAGIRRINVEWDGFPASKLDSKRKLNTMHYLSRANDANGYPAMDFEDWYQQGISCFNARLPKSLRKQALRAQVKRWTGDGKRVVFWMIRAFAYGAAGQDGCGPRIPWVSKDYRWPTTPDAAWQLVVCCYPNGDCDCDLDMVHPVSRKFWSEDNGFFDPPENGHSHFSRTWDTKMGFDVITMDPSIVMDPYWISRVQRSTKHLSMV